MMFRNLKAWLIGKRNGATSGAESVEKAIRQTVEGPDVQATQPMRVAGEMQAPGDRPAQAPAEPAIEMPKPIQIIITFEGEGSAEFSFHRDARISPMMLCPVIDYMITMRDLEYQTIVLDQKRKAAEQEQSRIKIARNPMPKLFRGSRRK